MSMIEAMGKANPNEVSYISGDVGDKDPLTQALNEYRTVMARYNTPAHPIENYFGSVDSQENYRPAMMQYIASGGKTPNWYTGNYDVDKPNIDAAVAATMTPQQQIVRQEAQSKMADLQETRKARLALAQETEARRTKDSAAKQEGLVQKNAIPSRDNRMQALNVLGGILGDDFAKMPIQAQDAAATRAASVAKMQLGKPESAGVDYESLVQDAYNEMIANGELKLPDKGSFFGLVGSHPAQFKPAGVAQPGAAPSTQATAQAPASAVAYLKQHPELNSAFKAKYGYLPE